jgi:hypothetical protein
MLTAVAVALLLAPAAMAQWSADPTKVVVIADRPGAKSQPKIRSTQDGGCYVSWLDDGTGGYDVYLQRLDDRGQEQWAHNGILVADRGFYYTEDYGLDVDAEGNAVLAFRDDRGIDVQITVAKVSADGTLIWGVNGVQVSDWKDDVISPRIVVTSDGDYVVAWTKVSGRPTKVTVELQKLPHQGQLYPGGSFLWNEGVSLKDEEGLDFMLSDLKASDDGGVVVSLIRQGEELCSRRLWAQKLSDTGALLWGDSHLAVFDAEAQPLQAGYFPTFVTDGDGGAVFTWYFFVNPATTQCAVQRILADGGELFTHNGVVISTEPGSRRCPSVTFDPPSEQIYVFWEEQWFDPWHGLQFAVFGQALDTEGRRLWTDDGLVVAPFNAVGKTPIRALQCGEDAMVFFEDEPESEQYTFGARLNPHGDLVWEPPNIRVGSFAWRLDAALGHHHEALLTWTDGSIVYARTVNHDGSLGLAPKKRTSIFSR